MCLYPKLIDNPKYKPNKKNGGQVPPLNDPRVRLVPIGCGQCIECRKQKQRTWAVRLYEDIKVNTNGKFIALTFSDKSIAEIHNELKKKYKTLPEGYDLDNAIAKYAVRHFLENWRKQHKKSLRHWLVTELGHQGTENIHIHGIIWPQKYISQWREELEKIWHYGYVYPRNQEETKKNFISGASVSYITKYISKMDLQHKHYKPIVLTSPGIGANYAKSYDARRNKYNGEETNEAYRTSSGHKMTLPIYYRNKIYTDDEREKLWIDKLNKEERYVLGTKIDVSEKYDEYINAIEYAREWNKEMGYLDANEMEKNWNRKVYEQQRRGIIIQTRIQKGMPPAG